MDITQTPAFNAYGTKYIVHITSQQNSASNFTIGSGKIEKIEDAFQVNRLLCSCLEGMRSMFAPKTNLEMTLLRNIGNYLRKRFTFCWKAGITGRIPTVKSTMLGKAFFKSESRTSVTFKL